ncbi:MAG TPA: Ig-like domain-containing protein [Kofleriaceae bacterium]|nr:Ig-like domain-containing protein [Kofleriaceae bacterium]
MALVRKLAAVSMIALVALTAACGGDDDDDAGDPGDADDGEPDASTDPLTILARTPDRNDPNVWIYDPIELEFSQPLDPDSIDDAALSLNSRNRPVPFDLELSPDRTRLIARITAPLETPASLTIAVAESVRNDAGQGFAGDLWIVGLPPWQQIAPVPAAAGTRPATAADSTGQVAAAWIDAGGAAVVSRLERGAWSQIGSALGAGAVTDVRLVFGDGDAPIAAWREGAEAHVSRFDGTDWVALGGPLPTVDGAAADLAVDGDGQPVVGAVTSEGIAVLVWNGEAFAPLGPVLPVADGTTEMSLAMDGSVPVVAASSGDALSVSRLDGDGWSEVGGGPVAGEGASAPDLVARSGDLAIAWRSEDGASSHVLASRLDGDGAPAVWRAVATAADLDIQDAAGSPTIALGADGEVTLAWAERGDGGPQIYAARSAAGAWQFLDSALTGADGEAGDPAVALDSRGVPAVVWREVGGVAAARWNDSPVLRHGLAGRAPAGPCAIPADAPPATLAGTGCYADVAAHQLAPGLVPFSVNSPLWSDGALKRRFLLVPDGQSATAPAEGSWQVPVGTIVVKEFWLETLAGAVGAEPGLTRFPVETRFLVKRCEELECDQPWQGYSYQWNPAGSEADLLTGEAEVRVAWPVVDPTSGEPAEHTHIYPGRDQCLRCHNSAAGRVLGLQTAQLDRSGDFGGVIDNQLRAMEEVGLIERTEPGAALRLPSSLDPSFSLEQRSRAYFHANCSHCHRPGGENVTIDFRFEAPLAADNICNQLDPGNGTASVIYGRDAARGAGQMPPIATDAADGEQLSVTERWINQMTSCP